jgi:hypothetical protein
MAWYDPRKWFAPPKQTGTIETVTPPTTSIQVPSNPGIGQGHSGTPTVTVTPGTSTTTTYTGRGSSGGGSSIGGGSSGGSSNAVQQITQVPSNALTTAIQNNQQTQASSRKLFIDTDNQTSQSLNNIKLPSLNEKKNFNTITFASGTSTNFGRDIYDYREVNDISAGMGGGDNIGISGSLRSGISNLFGSISDRSAGREEGFEKIPILNIADPLSERSTGLRFGFVEASGMAIKSTATDVIDFIKGKDKSPERTTGLSFFDFTGKAKADKTVYFKESPGTIINFGQPDEKGFIEPVTYLDIQKETEMRRGLELSQAEFQIGEKIKPAFSSFQSRVDEGEDFDIVQKESEDFLKDINVGYRQRQMDIFTSNPDIQGLDVRSGAVIKDIVPAAIDLGVATAAGLGGPAVALPAVGYFIGKGIYLGTKKPTVEESFGLALEGFKVDEITGRLYTEKTQSDIYYEGLRKQAGLSLVTAGAIGIGSVLPGIDKQINIARLEAFDSQKFSIGGRELIKQGDTTLLKVTGSKATRSVSGEFNVLFPIKQKGSRFIIDRGVGQAQIRFADYSKNVYAGGENIIKTNLDFALSGVRGVISPNVVKQLGKSGSLDISKTLGDDVVGAYGRGFFIEKGKVTTLWKNGDQVVQFQKTGVSQIRVGGVSQDKGDIINVISGQLTKARLYSDGTRTALFKPDAVGIIKRQTVETSDDLFRSFTGGGKKSSQEFFQNLYKQDLSAGSIVAQETGKKAFQSITSSIKTSLTKPIFGSVSALSTSSIYTGKGQYEKTDTIQSQNLRRSFIQSNIIETQTKTQQATATLFSTGQIGGSSLRNVDRTLVIPITRLTEKTTQKQTTKTIPRTIAGISPGLNLPPISNIYGSFTPRPFLPKLPLFFKGRGSGFGSLFKDIGQRYTPSLTAVAFNITGKIPTRFRGGRVDPFGRRVIANGKKRRNTLGLTRSKGRIF